MKHIDTILVQAGRDTQMQNGFVNPPVVRGSTVLFSSVEASLGRFESRYSYGLTNTPTIEALADPITLLEEAAGTVLVPSGLAAVTLAITSIVESGMRLFVPDNVYWPTRRYCDETLRRIGVETVYYDALISGEALEAELRKGPSALLLEAPGSQTFEMPDLRAHIAAAKATQTITMIDNTWATPLIYKPIPEGIDLSIQAGTKYYGGHSDLLLGSVSASEALWDRLRDTHRNIGVQAGTEEIFLTIRGLRTLSLRLAHHEASAFTVARWLQSQPCVSRVLHPGLPEDPGYDIWKDQFGGKASGLFAFVLDGTEAEAMAAMNAFELFGIGYSWGGFESLAVLADLSSRTRSARPWTEGPVIRLNIGLEHPDDLISDLAQAFHAAGLKTA